MKKMNSKTPPRRGEIFWVDFDPSKATEVKKIRPALVCSHDIMNASSSRVIVAPITSNIKKIYFFEYSLQEHREVKGKVMLDQIRSIDQSRLGKKLDALSLKEMEDIEGIIKFLLGMSR